MIYLGIDFDFDFDFCWVHWQMHVVVSGTVSSFRICLLLYLVGRKRQPLGKAYTLIAVSLCVRHCCVDACIFFWRMHVLFLVCCFDYLVAIRKSRQHCDWCLMTYGYIKYSTNQSRRQMTRMALTK